MRKKRQEMTSSLCKQSSAKKKLTPPETMTSMKATRDQNEYVTRDHSAEQFDISIKFYVIYHTPRLLRLL